MVSARPATITAPGYTPVAIPLRIAASAAMKPCADEAGGAVTVSAQTTMRQRAARAEILWLDA